MNDDMRDDPRSLGLLIRELTEDLSSLVRSEIELAKLELQQSAVQFGTAGALFAVAVFLAMGALVFFLVTAMLALDLVMPAWLAALILAVILLAAAGGVGMVARKKLDKVRSPVAPMLDRVREDVEIIRDDVSRKRGGDND